MQSKAYKGEFGYIKYRKQVAIIRTAICFIIAVGLYVIGLIFWGSQRNILSIVAALGCLPTGWSAVNLVMMLKDGYCSACTQQIKQWILSTVKSILRK